MATRQAGPERLPIKLILPKQGIERKVSGGGGSTEPFRPVDADYRQRLTNQVAAIKNAIVPQMADTGAAPIRVKLVQQALAKSHRPQELFSADSCPLWISKIFINRDEAFRAAEEWNRRRFEGRN